jgi:hypothetical protein
MAIAGNKRLEIIRTRRPETTVWRALAFMFGPLRIGQLQKERAAK